ncbi:hypothetical protein [Mucilaginibacter sp. BT774]|uniref:hypothetical protein n=1 Tax=Mucilaginibacter sp. BT774 TaxID=3062276 RepID=UPI002675F257|nr:hypothetical protein [Mucilaginibacter sp. BT774]MDO3625205.1 hypothetical protein [Mucilaginibacter sp. BT774]
MSIPNYGIAEIKKELQHLDNSQLTELCLRLVRYKKENKELTGYLLFDADNERAFIDALMAESGLMFSQLPYNNYQLAKSLRKILRLLGKYIKFMASSEAEVEVLINFCRNYVQYVDKRASSTYKPLRLIFTRQLDKIRKSITKLHEDLQFDYSQDFNNMVGEAEEKLRWLNMNDYLL